MSLFVTALALLELLFETAALVLGIVEFAEAVGNFHLSNEDLKSLSPVGLVRLLFRKRRDGCRELIDDRGLSQMLLGSGFKQVCDGFSNWLVGVVCDVRMSGVEAIHQRLD